MALLYNAALNGIGGCTDETSRVYKKGGKLMKPAKMQLELRNKVDAWLDKGFRVTSRDPLTLCKDDVRVVWNGHRFVLAPLEPEPKRDDIKRESRPYEKGNTGIDDGIILR